MTGSPRAQLILPQAPRPHAEQPDRLLGGTGSWRTLQLSCQDLQGARRLLSEAKLQGGGGGVVVRVPSACAPPAFTSVCVSSLDCSKTVHESIKK